MLKKNMTANVTVSDVNNLGYGVARVDGTVVFIKNGVTGDKVAIKIIKAAKDYGVAIITAKEKESPHRVSPACKVSHRCGGCVYQHITYEYEKELKENYVRNAMKKAGISDLTVHPVMGTDITEGYRNKAQYPLCYNEKGEIVGGFYAEKSHTVIPTEHCLLQPRIFSELLARICTLLTEYRVSLYDETTHRGLVRHICMRRGSGGISLLFVVNGTTFPHAKEIAEVLTKEYSDLVAVGINENRTEGNEILGHGYYPLYGNNYITDTLCGVLLRISPLSFYQVNHDATELLYGKVKELLSPEKDAPVLDLYCGIGSIGLSLARNCGQLFGIEIIPEAIENAKINARINGIENAAFFVGDSADVKSVVGEVSFPGIILDPPRKGLSPSVVKDVSSLSPEKIVYVSCNPDTLARDMALFFKEGYTAKEVFPFDLFPRTGHVETVVLMSRTERKMP